MRDTVTPEKQSVPGIRFSTILTGLILPLAIFALAATWLVVTDPLRFFDASAPPIEKLSVEQTILNDTGIHLKIRAGGSKPMTIAQVQVDGAYWEFTQQPVGKLPRLSAAWLHMNYPWVSGEVHVITMVTNTGVTFDHEIEVAIANPGSAAGGFATLALIGAFVGFLPVAVGMMFFPLLQRLSSSGTRFILALTLGMLLFLLIDVIDDAFELGSRAATALQGPLMVVLVATFTTLTLIGIGRRKGPPGVLSLAIFMAIGIGMHNFGEGLAIGSALAAGSASLGVFLVLGFSIHNITEGIGIAAPLTRKPPPLLMFGVLALIAGLPVIPGIWLGSFAIAPHWAAFALAIGIGAIIQVLFEVSGFMVRTTGGLDYAFDRYALGGFAIGLAFMYVTGVAIKV